MRETAAMVRYCPAGDGTFDDWVARCPECGRPLQASPPAAVLAPVATTEPVVYLGTVANEPLAQLAEGVLAEAGIRAMIKPAGPGYGAWGSVATFEHQIYVLASRVEEARQILAALEAEEDDPAEDVDDAAPDDERGG